MIKKALITVLVILSSSFCFGQSEIHPQHFNLSEVELLDGPLKTSLKLNFVVLLNYDQDRLLTPFVRDAGLSTNGNLQT